MEKSTEGLRREGLAGKERRSGNTGGREEGGESLKERSETSSGTRQARLSRLACVWARCVFAKYVFSHPFTSKLPVSCLGQAHSVSEDGRRSGRISNPWCESLSFNWYMWAVDVESDVVCLKSAVSLFLFVSSVSHSCFSLFPSCGLFEHL